MWEERALGSRQQPREGLRVCDLVRGLSRGLSRGLAMVGAGFGVGLCTIALLHFLVSHCILVERANSMQTSSSIGRKRRAPKEEPELERKED
jgi:hypothetical protein